MRTRIFLLHPFDLLIKTCHPKINFSAKLLPIVILLLLTLESQGAEFDSGGMRLPHSLLNESDVPLGTGVNTMESFSAFDMFLPSPFITSGISISSTTPRSVSFGVEKYQQLKNYTRDNLFGVSANVTTPWGSLAASYNRDTHFQSSKDESKFTLYARGVAVKEALSPFAIKNATMADLQPDVTNLLYRLKSGEDATTIRREFLKKYGTGFVQQRDRGGLFEMTHTVRIEGQTNRETIEKAISLAASRWGSSASINATSRNATVSSLVNTTMKTVGEFYGGGGNVLAGEPTPEAVREFLNGSGGTNWWMDRIATNPYTLNAVVIPYSKVPLLAPLASDDLRHFQDPFTSAFCYFPPEAPQWVHVRIGDGEEKITYGLAPLLVVDANKPTELEASTLRIPLKRTLSLSVADAKKAWGVARQREENNQIEAYLPIVPPKELREGRIWIELLYPDGTPEHLFLEPTLAMKNKNIRDLLENRYPVAEFAGSKAALELFQAIVRTNGMRYKTMVTIDDIQIVDLSPAGEYVTTDWEIGAPKWANAPLTINAKSAWTEVGWLAKGQKFRVEASGQIRLSDKEFGKLLLSSPYGLCASDARRNHSLFTGKITDWNRDYTVTEKACIGALIYKLEYTDNLGKKSAIINQLIDKPVKNFKPKWIDVPENSILSLGINDKGVANNSGNYQAIVHLSVPQER